jgi:hypothetical protein
VSKHRGESPAGSLPWSDHDRAEDKTRIFRYVAYSPEGTPLSKVVRDVFEDGETGYSNTDYKFTKRHVEEFDYSPEWFYTEKVGRRLWVYPTSKARRHVHLNSSKQSVGTPDGAGFDSDTEGSPGFESKDRGSTEVEGGDDGGREEGPPRYAKERARGLLSSVGGIDADSLRADLLGELGTELDSIEDRYTMLQRIRGTVAEFLFIAYATRFNSPERAGEIQRKFRRAVDRGEERYGSACLLTLTTDRKRFSSVIDAVDEILANNRRLFDRLDYDAETGPPRPGYRVPHIYVPEFTDSGLVHLHVLCFGVNFLYSQAALSTLWDDLGQAEVVDIRALPKRGGHFYMPRRSGDDRPGGVRETGEGSVRVRDYLSKTIGDLQRLADMSPEEVEETAAAIRRGEVEDRDADLWKLALYWSCSLGFWNGSPEFTREDSEEGDDLPHVPCYEYVGTARLGEFPAYALDRGVIVSRGRGPPRPPPSDDGDAPLTTAGTPVG